MAELADGHHSCSDAAHERTRWRGAAQRGVAGAKHVEADVAAHSSGRRSTSRRSMRGDVQALWQDGLRAASTLVAPRFYCARQLHTGFQKCVCTGTAPVPVFPRCKPGATGSNPAHKSWSMRLLLHCPMPTAPFASAYMAHSSGIDCRAKGMQWCCCQHPSTEGRGWLEVC